MKYGVFSDESKHTASRYRSIGVVSLPVDLYENLNERLNHILQDSNVTEFKWQRVKGAKYRFCAQKLIDVVLDQLIPFNHRGHRGPQRESVGGAGFKHSIQNP